MLSLLGERIMAAVWSVQRHKWCEQREAGDIKLRRIVARRQRRQLSFGEFLRCDSGDAEDHSEGLEEAKMGESVMW